MSQTQKTNHKVTPNDIINSIYSFIATNGDGAINGSKAIFTLNPSCINVLKDYLFFAKQKATLPERDQEIKSFVTDVLKIKIIPNRPNILEDRTSFNLNLFKGLQRLQIEMVKPTLINDITFIRNKLVELKVHHSLNSLSELLDCEIDKEPWTFLTFLDCSKNNIPEIDGSMELVPKVKKLNLSDNLLKSVKNLEHNPYLDMLNVSSNNLIDLVNIHKVIGNIRVLSLSKNNIMDLGDIGKLYSLEKLDLAFNKIPDFSQIQKLSTLPLLTHIVLRGNPIAQYPNYRTTFFSCFHPRSHEIFLDDVPASAAELVEATNIALQAAETNQIPIRLNTQKVVRRVIELDNKQDSIANETRTENNIEKFKSDILKAQMENKDNWLIAFEKEFSEPITIKKKKKSKRKKQNKQSVNRTEDQTEEIKINNIEPEVEFPSETEEQLAHSNNEPKVQITEPIVINNKEVRSSSSSTLSESSDKKRRLTKKILPKVPTIEFEVEKDDEFGHELDYRILVCTATSITEKTITTGFALNPFFSLCQPLTNFRLRFTELGENKIQIGKDDIKSLREGKLDKFGHPTMEIECTFVDLSSNLRKNDQKVIYHFNDRVKANLFLTIWKEILSDNVPKLICLTCKHVFEGFTKQVSCPKCKSSEKIEDYFEIQTINNDIRKIEHNVELDNGEFSISRKTISKKLESHFVLQFFSGIEDESFLYLLRCSLLPFEPQATEIVGTVLISTKAFYILEQRQNLSGEKFFYLKSKIRIEEIQRVVAGFFFQWVRMESQNFGNLVFVTRVHGDTHDFFITVKDHLAQLKSEQEMYTSIDIVPTVKFCNLNRQILRNISLELLANEPPSCEVDFYFQAFMKSKEPSNYTGCNIPASLQLKGNENLKPVSFINIEGPSNTHKIMICEEDLTQWPSISDETETSSPQFLKIASKSVDSIFRMAIDSSQPYSLCIYFDGQETDCWDLFIPDLRMKQKIIAKIYKYYSALLGMKVPIIDRIAPNSLNPHYE